MVSEELDKRIGLVVRLLEDEYGSPRHGNLDDPLDELVYIKLSQQTNAAKFEQTFQRIKESFGGWDRLMETKESDVALAIRGLGLHMQRAKQLQAMLRRIHLDRGRLELDWLRGEPVDTVVGYLTGLPGVGIKTAYCVAMYSLGLAVLPVDTHVERVARRLGLVSAGLARRSRQGDNRKIHEALAALVPPIARYSFHVNCVAHGRAVCSTRRPKCDRCVVSGLCHFCCSQVRGESPVARGRS